MTSHGDRLELRLYLPEHRNAVSHETVRSHAKAFGTRLAATYGPEMLNAIQTQGVFTESESTYISFVGPSGLMTGMNETRVGATWLGPYAARKGAYFDDVVAGISNAIEASPEIQSAGAGSSLSIPPGQLAAVLAKGASFCVDHILQIALASLAAWAFGILTTAFVLGAAAGSLVLLPTGKAVWRRLNAAKPRPELPSDLRDGRTHARERYLSAWRAISLRAPDHATRIEAAQEACDRLLGLAYEDGMSIEAAEWAVAVERDLPDMIDDMLSAERFSDPPEQRRLVDETLTSIDALAVFADEKRRILLSARLEKFQTARTFLDSKTAPEGPFSL